MTDSWPSCNFFYITARRMIARHPCGTGNGPVPLLPSGPGGVRGVPLRRTRLSAAGIFHLGVVAAPLSPLTSCLIRTSRASVSPLAPCLIGALRARMSPIASCPISTSRALSSLIAPCLISMSRLRCRHCVLSHKYVRASLEPALNYHNRRVATDLARTFSTRRQWRRRAAVAIKDLCDGRAANSYRPYPDDVRAGAGAEPGEGGRPRRGGGRPRCADRLPPGALSFALPVPGGGDGAIRISRADSRTDEREAGAACRGAENRDRRADLRAPCGRRLP